ncbi:MAG: Receptor family ligand binding region [Frankiales bacterium]|nr:Receptor family ligand binding region [Frankiales bacterium]
MANLTAMITSRHHVAALACAAAALTACSSAPAPASLVAPTGGPEAPTQASGAPTVDPVTGKVTVPTKPGAPGAPAGGTAGSGPNGGTGGTGGGTSGGGSGTSGGGSTGTSLQAGDPPGTRSHLFTPKEDRIGITPTSITMCAHAALTYGAAFNTTDADFNVFWSSVNDHGGIFGRKVNVTYENDNYTAADAKTAATACHAKNPFMLLGGIGFDQIPAVRNYVETVHQLYLHHTATIEGTAGQKYSFSELPTVERLGRSFAQLAHEQFPGRKIGIIERDSPNWSPGVAAFKQEAKKYGLKIVADDKVTLNQGNYTQQLLDMKNAGAEVMLGWENVLSMTEMIKQAKSQVYSPHWMVVGSNLMTQTLGKDSVSPPIVGSVMFDPYSFGDYSGGFARYADDMKLFEAQYKQYRPKADLKGVGGDLLFLNWTAQKALYAQLQLCGKDCTRNRFIDVLTSYRGRPSSSSCDIDFPNSDGYRGANQLNFVTAYRAPDGTYNFKMLKPCVGP